MSLSNTELELADILFETLDFIDDLLVDQFAFTGPLNQEAKRKRIEFLMRRLQELTKSDE